MADFEIALKVVLRHEGGFSNNPLDEGKATHFGISAQLLSLYLGQPVSVDEMKTLTLDQAASIYKKIYWQQMNLDSINDQNLATIILDMGALLGVPRIVHFVQEILHLEEDGILGSATVAAINDYVSSSWLSAQLLYRCQSHFVADCQQNTTQLEFLQGWLNRSQDLLDLVVAR